MCSRLYTVRITVVAMALLCMLAIGGSAKNLYPTCGGQEVSVTASAGKETVLYTFPGKSQALSIECLAYEVTSVIEKKKKKDKDTKDYCLVKHQTEYSYALLLRASYKVNGEVVSKDYSIRDIVGGSIAGMTVHEPASSTFSIVFSNRAADERCSLSVRAIFDTEVIMSETGDDAAPVLVGIQPSTIFAQSHEPSYFVLKHPTDGGHSDAVITLVYLTDRCGSAAPAKYLNIEKEIPKSYQLAVDGTLSARSLTFYEPGSFRMCYSKQGAPQATEIAVITVFGGNPSYYEVVDGLDKDGQVRIGEPAIIKFYGYDLDTRPGGDSAKFVDEWDTCDAGVPAGGVPMATDLGPNDDFGPNTTYTLWRWTIRVGGTFRVCYKRKDKEWTEVPIISDVGPGSATEPPEVLPYPIPVDPETGVECPTAPKPSGEQRWVNYSSVRITMKEKSASGKFIENFFATFTKLFCVPRSALSVVRLTHDRDGRQVAYFVFLCDGITDKYGSEVCSNYERSNYAASLAKSQDVLDKYGIAEIAGSTSMAVAEDDPSIIIHEKGTLGIAILCLTLITITLIIVYAVFKYREKREYFVQFGMDDADIDDMYEAGLIPSPHEEMERQHIRGAVIEIED